jgi:ATP/maltotriose-dependent transcriptional regulator MalT
VLGEAELLSGRVEEAEGDLRSAIDLARRSRADVGQAHAMQRLAETALAAGRPDQARARLAECASDRPGVLARAAPPAPDL